jgi:hypothetical protein
MIEDNELNIIKDLFNNTIGISISESKDRSKIHSEETKKFFEALYDFRSLSLIKYSEEIKQFHLLYLICLLYLDYNDNVLKMDQSKFRDEIYYPNIMNIIASSFDQCKTIIKKQVREAYKQVREHSGEVVDFYLVFYGTEPTIIHNDIISIFIKGLFLEEDPINLDNIGNYYLTVFRFILYSYLKNRTSNIMSFEIDPSILEDDCAMNMSSRYKIYERGLRISHIQQLCKGSETLSRISDNYDKIRNDIMKDNNTISENYLQRKYHDIVDGSRVRDNKILVLKSSNNENYNLSKISKKLPLIYKLLRSIHVKSKNTIMLDSDKKLIHDTIREVTLTKFKERLVGTELELATQGVTMALTNSLVRGSFIDPYTMETINITGCLFSRQLRTFLSILFTDMDM